MKVAGSIALVTGANRGLGLAFAKALVERGEAKVYAAARNTIFRGHSSLVTRAEGSVADNQPNKQWRTDMLTLNRRTLLRTGSAAGATPHQISAPLAAILATVLMASPSSASSVNVHWSVHAPHVGQPEKDSADYLGLYGYEPRVPATGEPAWPYNYCPGYLPGESPEEVCPDESSGG
jgi:hypothetical protein